MHPIARASAVDVTLETVRVMLEIAAERRAQIDRGFDAGHDDRKPLSDLAWLLARRANDLQAPSLAQISEEEPRRLAVEIATIAVAMIESMDRRAVAEARREHEDE